LNTNQDKELAWESGMSAEGEALPLDELVWRHIEQVLAEHKGNISAAARALRMHRRTLQRRLRKLRSRANGSRNST
jgi:two-component system, response regulator RegA